MTQRQKLLFSSKTIPAVPQKKNPHNKEKTRAQLYDESREARDQIDKQIEEIGKMFDLPFTPENYQDILNALKKLQNSDLMVLLYTSKTRGNPDYHSQRLQWIEWFQKRAEMGLTSLNNTKHEYWVKYKSGEGADKFAEHIFTCCSKRTGFHRWVFDSTRGRLYCAEHFKDKFGASRIKGVPERPLK